MSDSYTKLFRSITASTICSEPVATRWLWVTMLSQADQRGDVWGSVPGLARIANITLEECEAALQCFLSPDPYSRTQENEGRRIAIIDGGWHLLNHAKYSAMRNQEERAAYKRQWDRENRSKSDKSDTNPTISDKPDKPDSIETNPINPTPLALTPTPDVRARAKDSANPDGFTDVIAGDDFCLEAPQKKPRKKQAKVPIREIIAMYHETLPTLPAIEKVTRTRVGYIRQRWIEDLPTLAAWHNFFSDVKNSKFLMGLTPARGDQPPFRANLEWLTRPTNFTKVLEGKYHRG